MNFIWVIIECPDPNLSVFVSRLRLQLVGIEAELTME